MNPWSDSSWSRELAAGLVRGRSISLTVVSYNLHAGRDGQGRPSLHEQADLLIALKPDLVALQELDRDWPRSGSVDQTAFLAGRLEMRAFYAPNLLGPWQPGQKPYEYGVSVLWRGGPGQANGFALPSVPGREPRGFASVQLKLGETPVVFVSTHFGRDAAERQRQAAFLAGWAAGRDETMLLGGDFNMLPGSSEYQLLLAKLRDLTAEANLLTFPSNHPEIQIDYIFASPNVEVISAQALPAPASDHLPVVVEIRV